VFIPSCFHLRASALWLRSVCFETSCSPVLQTQRTVLESPIVAVRLMTGLQAKWLPQTGMLSLFEVKGSSLAGTPFCLSAVILRGSKTALVTRNSPGPYLGAFGQVALPLFLSRRRLGFSNERRRLLF
jgi:hypothetical protein